MKIAVIYPQTVFCGWSHAEGWAAVAERMGHTAIRCPVPPRPQGDVVPTAIVDRLKRNLPKIEELSTCDLVLVSGPEHIACWIDVVYGAYEWKNKITCPKALIYHESAMRADKQEIMFDTVSWTGDYHFFPAAQDAELFEQPHLYGDRAFWSPFAVDTEIFKPFPCDKKYEIIALGLLYGIRAQWLEQLGQYRHPEIRIGRCHYETVEGADVRKTAELMAADITASKVFFVLPPLSLLHVHKVFEAMACGVLVVAPRMPSTAQAHLNNKLFQDSVHLRYYDPVNKASTGRMLFDVIDDKYAIEREAIACQGAELIAKEHSLEKRLEFIMEKCGCSVTML